jgi:hypothetical protein
VLNFNSTGYSLEDARELYQHAVAGGLYDPPAILPYFGIDHGASVGLQLSQSALLVGTHGPNCPHPGCRLAGITFCQCFGGRVARPPVYAVWATPAHPEKPWAVGREIRLGCLRVSAYVESKRLADLLEERLSGGDY